MVLLLDQGSLSFQLLCTGGGLYDFGRSLCLLSTVTGFAVPYSQLNSSQHLKKKIPKEAVLTFFCLKHLLLTLI